MYIIGGWLGGGTIAACDVHEFDFDTRHWRACPSSPSSRPCNMHTADVIPNTDRILVFRGGDGQQYLNDLLAYVVSRNEWSKVPCLGRGPSPRANHASAVMHNKLFIFGGWNGTERLNDLHMLDTASMTWIQLNITGKTVPLPRAGMTMTAIGNKLYLFGGSGAGAKVFDDLYIIHIEMHENNVATAQYDLYASEFTLVSQRSPETPAIRGIAPGKRSGHTSVATRDGKIIIIGGYGGNDYVRVVSMLETDRPPEIRVTAESVATGLTERLKCAALSELYSDVTFIVEGQAVYAHKLVLSLANKRFETMFSHGFQESLASVIELHHTDHTAFCSLVTYLYSGETPELLSLLNNDPMGQDGFVSDERLQQAINLLQLADEYLCPHLKQLCEVHLSPLISDTTVEHFRDVSEAFNAAQLLNRCEHYLRYHDVVATDASQVFVKMTDEDT